MKSLTFARAEQLSHAYIVLSPSADERRKVALQLAAAAVCSEKANVPCGHCRACRKVAEGIHPDVITVARRVDDKGKQKREISVDQVRDMSADAVVLPNEAERKVYVIEDADSMNISAQNAALKLLEEPPAGVIFVLLAANAELLLPTVRSRCSELICNTQDEPLDEEAVKLSLGYLKLCAEQDEAALFRWCCSHESMDNASAVAFCETTEQVLTQMLCRRGDALGLDDKRLYDLTQLMEEALRLLRVNTGVKHVMALLCVRVFQ